ncbi:MAG TPA: c-type cytochrome [Pseudomonas sp.]
MHTVLLLLGLNLAMPLQAARLTVELADGEHRRETTELLQHPMTRTLQIRNDVSYKRDMTYRAIPVAVLLNGVKPQDHLQAVATDGFAAELSAAPLLQQTGAQAWVAIEDPAHPWPMLGNGKHSAGPFYLVWTNPQASGIGPEQWPYALGRIRALASLAERFPALVPDSALAADDPVNAGFTQFQKNCLACHRLNGAGDSQLGPDLNLPHSPTEYFTGDYLRLYIRDPQKLRQWPQAKMPAISTEVLSDAELDQVISYLQHMAQRRQAGVTD